LLFRYPVNSFCHDTFSLLENVLLVFFRSSENENPNRQITSAHVKSDNAELGLKHTKV
jgi:hypothetical protein